MAGCDEPGACNYDATATDNDGTCEYYTCAGCQDVDACNYDPDAVLVGTCDYLSCAGCQDIQACNYDSLATLPADCTFPDPGLDCDGECLVDDNGDGQCDQLPGFGSARGQLPAGSHRRRRHMHLPLQPLLAGVRCGAGGRDRGLRR